MITEDLRSELEALASEHPAPPPHRVVTGALSTARRIRDRRRATVAGVAVVGAVAVALALPGGTPRSTTGPFVTQGPTASGSPTVRPSDDGDSDGPTDGAAVLPRLRLLDCDGKVPGFCWMAPIRLEVDGATYVQMGSGSVPLRRGNRHLSLTTGHGRPKPSDYRVLVGIVGPRSARLPEAVAYVDGERVLTLPDGGPRLLDVHHGEHEVRLELTGPATARSYLVIVEYHRQD